MSTARFGSHGRVYPFLQVQDDLVPIFYRGHQNFGIYARVLSVSGFHGF